LIPSRLKVRSRQGTLSEELNVRVTFYVPQIPGDRLAVSAHIGPFAGSGRVVNIGTVAIVRASFGRLQGRLVSILERI